MDEILVFFCIAKVNLIDRVHLYEPELLRMNLIDGDLICQTSIQLRFQSPFC